MYRQIFEQFLFSGKVDTAEIKVKKKNEDKEKKKQTFLSCKQKPNDNSYALLRCALSLMEVVMYNRTHAMLASDFINGAMSESLKILVVQSSVSGGYLGEYI